jgi:hypothetical protein
MYRRRDECVIVSDYLSGGDGVSFCYRGIAWSPDVLAEQDSDLFGTFQRLYGAVLGYIFAVRRMQPAWKSQLAFNFDFLSPFGDFF